MTTLQAAMAAIGIALTPLSIGVPAAIGEMHPRTVEAMPRCQLEDGSDVDGQCAWIDPDTGDVYINPTPEEVARG